MRNRFTGDGDVGHWAITLLPASLYSQMMEMISDDNSIKHVVVIFRKRFVRPLRDYPMAKPTMTGRALEPRMARHE